MTNARLRQQTQSLPRLALLKIAMLASVTAVAFLTSISAHAGPDWYVIEKARAAARADVHAAQATQKTVVVAADAKNAQPAAATQPN